MNHVWQNIEGFSSENLLEHYKYIVNKSVDGSVLVEIGSYLGRSAAMMVVEIINSGKKIDFYCIDKWLGNLEGKDEMKDIFPVFKSNLEKYDLLKYIKVLKYDSIIASRLFDNESIDMVFIDADHSYEAVKKDIENWFPKVKINGILSGHDYHGDSHVIRAVNEKFPHIRMNGNIWSVVK